MTDPRFGRGLPGRRPAGFTLIELLVVVSILGVLAAIGTGAYFRVRGSQQVKTTEDTVSKLSSSFTQQWTAELDNARNTFKGTTPGFSAQVDNVKTMASGDSDRALALWTYLWMKNAYPQSFAEAINPTRLQVGAVVVSLPPKKAFSDIPIQPSPPAPAPPPLTPNTALSAGDQAAVLLYKALTASGSRGQTFNEEAIGALSAQLTDTLPTPPPTTMQYRVFTDTFGGPISFARMSSGNQNDVNAPPFLKGSGGRDPFDPAGRLQPGAWTINADRTAAASAFGFTDFSNTNWVPTLVSRGADRAWGTFPTAANGFIPIPDGFIAGYKLRRQGARGDQ